MVARAPGGAVSEVNITGNVCPTDSRLTLEDVLRTHRRFLTQAAWRIVSARAPAARRACLDSDDVFALLCTELVRKLPDYDPGRAKFTTWAAATVIRKVRGKVLYAALKQSGPVAGPLLDTFADGDECDRTPRDWRAPNPADLAAEHIDRAALAERIRAAAARLNAADRATVEAVLNGEPARLSHGARAKLREVLADLEPAGET